MESTEQKQTQVEDLQVLDSPQLEPKAEQQTTERPEEQKWPLISLLAVKIPVAIMLTTSILSICSVFLAFWVIFILAFANDNPTPQAARISALQATGVMLVLLLPPGLGMAVGSTAQKNIRSKKEEGKKSRIHNFDKALRRCIIDIGFVINAFAGCFVSAWTIKCLEFLISTLVGF